MPGLVTALIGTVLASAPGRYDGHVVVRATPQDEAQVDAVLELASDVWTERTPKPGVPVDVVIAPGDRASLDLSGVPHETLIDDLQVVVDAEHDRLVQQSPQLRGDWFSDFRELDALYAYVEHLNVAYPELTNVVEIGHSLEGRPILALEISGAGEEKPAVLINGTQHAREWISPMVNMYISDRLLRGYGSDSRITELLDATSVLVIPVVNPDGYVFTWTDERLWRKNRRDGVGVDLNRNWGAGWGFEPGSSDDPASQNYRGTGPFSEPETASVRQYVLSHPEIEAHIDFHSYSQLVLYPYSYTYDPPPMLGELAGWATELAEVLAEVHGTEYLPLYGPDFYFASGTAPDWTISELQSYSFTIELRPADSWEWASGFVLPPEQIVPTCEESMEGFLSLGEWVVGGGPDAIPPPIPPDDDDGDDGAVGDETGAEDTTDDGELATTTEDGGGTGGDTDGVSLDEGGTSQGCGCSSSPRGDRHAPLWLLAVLGFRRRVR